MKTERGIVENPGTVIDEETVQRIDWKSRLISAVINRDFDDETLAHMIEAGLNQAHSDGLIDAQYICNCIALARPHARDVALVIANAIRELDRRNKTTG